MTLSAEDLRAIDELAPTYGYFGDSADDCLDVAVGRELDRLTIQVAAPHEQFLNFNGLKLFVDGAAKPMGEIVKAVRFSSVYSEKGASDPTQTFITQGRVHSALELKPFVEVEFHQAFKIDKIQIYNLLNANWTRNRFLEIRGARGSEPWFPIRAVQAEDAFGWFAKLEDSAFASESSPDRRDLGSAPDEGAARRRALKREFVERLRDGRLSLADFRALGLVQLLCLTPSDNAQERDDDIAMIAAHAGVSLSTDWQFATLRLGVFSRTLSTAEAIDMMMSQLNLLPEMTKRFQGALSISKHQINPSVLMRKAKTFVGAMRWVEQSLDAIGIPSAICYGTLLGAVRNGRFIEHDDDVDMIYVDATSRSFGEALARSLEIEAHFKSLGCGTWRSWAKALNFSVTCEGASVDIFPFWLVEDKAFLMMEHFRVRSIGKELMLPFGRTLLYDEEFPSPGDAQGFLGERYGDGWRTPDKYHEWSWSMADAARSP